LEEIALIFNVLATMGKGKTLWSVLYAKEYSNLYPDNKIYSNFHIQLKNNIYTPFMIFTYNKIENSLIICDDFYNLKNLDFFISIVASLSRKMNLDIIMTCQYYTMVPPLLRMLSVLVDVYYDKNTDTLYSSISDIDKHTRTDVIPNAVKIAKNLYDTNEKVKIITDDAILDELKRFSDFTNEDKITALNMFFKNKQKIEKYKKYLQIE